MTRQELEARQHDMKAGPKSRAPEQTTSDEQALERRGELQPSSLATEPHYTVAQLAEMWQLSINTITRAFKGEPGVLHVGRLNSRVRTKILLRIPHSVAERVHKQMSYEPR